MHIENLNEKTEVKGYQPVWEYLLIVPLLFIGDCYPMEAENLSSLVGDIKIQQSRPSVCRSQLPPAATNN